jgi:hypothetical protein
MHSLQVGLSSWIIQDGNYPDFHAGQEYRFALEFYARDPIIDDSLPATRELAPIGNAKYRADGSVIFYSEQAWVIDIGVLAYQEGRPPANARVGSRIAGDIYLGIDPFFYFESLSALPCMPSLYRQWYVRSILLETTPWLETMDETGRLQRTRDASNVSCVEVSATDAWNHDEGHGHYVLDCEPR